MNLSTKAIEILIRNTQINYYGAEIAILGDKKDLLLSAHSKITELIISYYHEKSGHQGNHITLGPIRNAGFFVENGKTTIKKFIKGCVICNKLRKTSEVQLMD